MTNELDEIGHVTNEKLIVRLRALVRVDQALSARLLVHLGEVDARGLYRDHAYSVRSSGVLGRARRTLATSCAR